MNRRSLITGLISLVAAPAVIRTTGLIMPVRALPVDTGPDWMFAIIHPSDADKATLLIGNDYLVPVYHTACPRGRFYFMPPDTYCGIKKWRPDWYERGGPIGDLSTPLDVR